MILMLNDQKLYMEAMGQRVIVKPDDIEEVTPSGLVIMNDKQMERASRIRGTLVSIGADCWFGQDCKMEIGDRVIYARHSGRSMMDEVTGLDYVILNDLDLICKILPKDEEALDANV